MELEQGFQLGAMRIEPRNGRFVRDETSVDVEPKVMSLLCLLAETPGEAVSKDEIFARVWPDVTVNDDALSRAIWKLRQALGDDARDPVYIATVPKKGYRLLVTPELIADPAMPAGTPPEAQTGAPGFKASTPNLVLLGVSLIMVIIAAGLSMYSALAPQEDEAIDPLIARADEFYYQITQADNAAAMRLYQEALDIDPNSAPAHAGMANTITQQVVRWSEGDWPEVGLTSRIRTALANGRTQTQDAIDALARARNHAETSVGLDADYALGYRALGLVQSAQGEIEAAMESYNRAVTLDPDAWEVFINLADMHNARGEGDLALAHMERAFEAMSRVYESQTVRVRPWYSITGLSVARSYAERDDLLMAERWYRRILQWDPLNAEALTGLAAILAARGDDAGVREVCAPLSEPDERAVCLGRG